MKTKIAVSGAPGSFSEEAGLIYSEYNNLDPEVMYSIDMHGVLKAITGGQAEIGIFPVVNSQGGLVQTAFEAMGEYSFKFVDILPMEVRQCLMALPGTKKEDIAKITTHPQAISQCKEYIQKNLPNAELIEWKDTAKAAEDLSKGEFDSQTATIAPARSAELYNLELIEAGIQDVHPNITTFIIVKPL